MASIGGIIDQGYLIAARGATNSVRVIENASNLIRGAAHEAPKVTDDLIQTQAALATKALNKNPVLGNGPVADALSAGKLLRSRPANELDNLETLLSTGVIDKTKAIQVGEGINGARFKTPVTSGDDTMWAVEKPWGHQGPQEYFAWKLGRELGIDHLLPATGKRADGAAMIEFKEGGSLFDGKITNAESLANALTASYLVDDTLKLSSRQAAEAGRIDKQLIQAFDYLLANNDRHLGNGIINTAGDGRVTMIDFGHMGRGARVAGATETTPSLRALQGNYSDKTVKLDDSVVRYIKSRLDPERIRAIHADAFKGSVDAVDQSGTNSFVKAERFVDGVNQRLAHLTENKGYSHISHSDLPWAGMREAIHQSEQIRNARGPGQVRAAFDGFAGGGGFGGPGGW